MELELEQAWARAKSSEPKSQAGPEITKSLGLPGMISEKLN